MLYIILLLIVLFIAIAYIRFKPGFEDRNRSRAIRELRAIEDSGTFEEELYPSWIDSKYHVNKFVSRIAAETKETGTPVKFIEELLTNENEMKKYLFLAANVEKSGSSFKEQARFVSAMLDDAWYRVPFSEYHKYIDEEV